MDNQSKFCMHCGKALQPGQVFCTNYGTRIGMQPVVQPVAQSPVVPVQPKKSKKKIWILSSVIATLLTIVAIVIFVFSSIKGQDRTIMVYMIGSDLESEAAAASLDITEIKEAVFDPEHTKILIYTGGTKKWALSEISAEENAIFEVVDGNINKVQTYDKRTMTNPQNVVDFIDFAYENYPADLYDIVFWDHGGGPILGYGLDENSLTGAPMKVTALAKALAETKLVTSGKRFDLIGFDACLMGSAEVAKAMSPYGDYMVASEEVEPGDGWNYSFLNDLGEERKAKNTEELGRSIIDNYSSYYENYSYDVDTSLSLIDLKKVNKLADSVDELFSSVKDEITVQTFSQYSRLMTREQVYGYTGRDSESYDLVDLIDLCGSLQNEYGDKVDKIRSDFNDIVLYSKSNMNNTNGLSVYFLNFNKAGAERMLINYKDVAFSEGYYEFLMKYKNFVTGDRMVSKAIYRDLNEEKVDGKIEIELPDELRDNYQSGEIIIFRKLGDNKFMPVYRSSEVELAGNKLKVTSNNLQFVIEVTGEEGIEYGWSGMAEKERTDEYADYVTFGVLYYNDDSSLGFSPKSYEMYIRVPKGSNEAQVRDIRVGSSTDLASKMSFAPDKIKFIDFTVGAYKLYNEAGELDYNMESHGVLYGTEANIEGGDEYKIKLVGLDYDFGNIYNGEFQSVDDYYAGFIVHDTQGDSHRLNLIHIE